MNKNPGSNCDVLEGEVEFPVRGLNLLCLYQSIGAVFSPLIRRDNNFV